MEILSPGQKIRKIRKEFKISQKEITGGEITRELISIIENNKSALTPAVAQIITDNINKICKEKNINFNLSAEYLLEDINVQSNKIADNFIEFLCNNENNLSKDISEDIKEIELFMAKYDVPEKKMIIYEKIGDILRNQKEFNRSYIYYIKAYENHNRLFNDIRLFKLLQKIGNTCIHLCKYTEALDFNNLALVYNDNVPEELKYKVLYNNILAYMYLKKYDKALIELEHIKTTFKNLTKENVFKLNILKVNCMRHKNFYSDAFKLNEYLLKTLDDNDTENIILVMANILDIYTVLKDTHNVKLYIDKLIYLVNNYNDIEKSYHSPNTYNQIALSCSLINNTDLSIEYYKKSIMACKYHRNIDILLKSLNELLTILVKERNLSEINFFKNDVLELLSLHIIEANITPIFKLLDFYNDINDNENVGSLLKFILDNRK
ncbi:helix-turn-helix transcriptional regulator [Clostridium sp. YIM B02515]|uniref:Helix-turn-helix transcriptional regulator n=1 Tax=Clostridium rhizosphaerae TaxID=2803861 RepID=A0ABS1TF64_9CLOT|nr:helix-turn-helix transcriptional regulator [Clostridium rhizosphaerae]MBL4937722.1 helix-turn-helix transcriptional regulator [Clostridium rhizosphaerae]